MVDKGIVDVGTAKAKSELDDTVQANKEKKQQRSVLCTAAPGCSVNVCVISMSCWELGRTVSPG